MKVVKFKKSFQLGDNSGKNIKVLDKGYYVFSDFILRQFVQSAKVDPNEIIEYSNDLDREYPVMNLALPDPDLKCVRGLVIVRTGGIGDLIALSHIPKIVKTIYNEQLNKDIRFFFVTDAKYSQVFKFYDSYVKPIFYFRTPLTKVFKESGIYEKSSLRSMFFEGLIEERDDNWFDIQWERLNLNHCKYIEKLDESLLVKRPFLINRQQAVSLAFDALRCTGSDVHNILINLKKDGYAIILINHRASAWIRTFNPNDVVSSLREYLKSNGIEKFKFVLFKRNFTKQDIKYFVDTSHSDVLLIKTDNLDEFFFTIAYADYVVSSDTAAHHFREGIGAPGLGIYSSFPMQMRCRDYRYTNSENILFSGCRYVCDSSNYVGCVSHFKTMWEVCPWVAGRYNQYLKDDHHFKRGNRIPSGKWLSELKAFVQAVGEDTLLDEHVFQYAPCCDSRWNSEFVNSLYNIYEKWNIADVLKNSMDESILGVNGDNKCKAGSVSVGSKKSKPGRKKKRR